MKAGNLVVDWRSHSCLKHYDYVVAEQITSVDIRTGGTGIYSGESALDIAWAF